MKKRILRLRKRAGFSLLELMVVLVIMGVLAALVAPRIGTYLRNAKIKSAQTQLGTIASALTSYFDVNERYPSNLKIIGKEYLNKAKLSSSGQLLDPWGVPYIYKTRDIAGVPAKSFYLASAGPDHLEATRDDILYNKSGRAVNAETEEDSSSVLDDEFSSDFGEENFE